MTFFFFTKCESNILLCLKINSGQGLGMVCCSCFFFFFFSVLSFFFFFFSFIFFKKGKRRFQEGDLNHLHLRGHSAANFKVVGSTRDQRKRLPKPPKLPKNGLEECVGSCHGEHKCPALENANDLPAALPFAWWRPASEILNRTRYHSKDWEIVAAKLEKPEGTRLCFVF